MTPVIRLVGLAVLAGTMSISAHAQASDPSPLAGPRVKEIDTSYALQAEGTLYGLDDWCDDTAQLTLILKPGNVGRVGYASLLDMSYQIQTINKACPKARVAVVTIYDPPTNNLLTELTPLPADHAPWREIVPVTIQLSK